MTGRSIYSLWSVLRGGVVSHRAWTCNERSPYDPRNPLHGVRFGADAGSLGQFSSCADHDHFEVDISGARATSSDGTTYLLPYVDQLVVNVLPGFESTSVVNYSLIGKGAAPNYRLQIIDRITVNANGDTAVLFDNATISC